MNVKSVEELADDFLKGTRLDPFLGLVSVAVHWIALVHNVEARSRDGLQHRWQHGLHVVASEAGDEDHAPGLVGRVDGLDELNQLLGLGGGANLDPDRVFNPAHKLDVSAIQLACAVADPHKMRREIVKAAVGALPRQRLLVFEQQA